ncbi:MAG: NADH-quinone oxidoreductase subunit C [Myxococcales bacterium]|nr:NADH-quinone oxidoreductase subunit C [Myxococcales bacterium]
MSKAVLDALKSKFGDAILETSSKNTDESVTVAVDKLIEVCTFLRDDEKMAFDSPVFLTCIDRLGLPVMEHRFELAVQLRSFTKRHRIRVKVPMEEGKLKVPTLSGLWAGFNWLERETYDMYGVEFEGHPDLRRIYLYDEFKGHPLRKDFPKDLRFPLARREWADE